MNRTCLTVVLLAAMAATAAAQDVKLSGQIRERSELDTRSLTIRQASDPFHLLRSRLRVDGTVNENVAAVFEVQDARRFGSDSIYNTASPAFTLRQGYVAVKLPGTPLSVRLGRQVLAYANERLLGAVDWSNHGQSFDAGLLRADFGDVSVDAFAAAIKRNDNPTGGYLRDVFLLGGWAAWKPKQVKSTLQGFYFYDNPATSLAAQQRHTAGLYASGEYFGFDFELDGAYQFGDIALRDSPDADYSIAAFMAGARLGYTFTDLWNLRIGAGIDLLSGNDSTSDAFEGFTTLYGTNHKFYGYMDYFTNIPQHTFGLGLQDIIVQLSAAPSKRFRVAADLHLLGGMIDPKVWGMHASHGPLRDAGNSFGKELDLTAWLKVADAVNLTCGWSVFEWDADRGIFPGRNTTNWGYLMTTVNF
jgi:hypothetical protein